MPGQRLRIHLRGLKPEDDPGAPALKGICAWTWDHPPAGTRPLAGQTACLTRPVLEAHSATNRADSDSEALSLSQNIHFRMWSKEISGDPHISGEPDFLAAQRQQLLQKFLGAHTPGSGDIPPARAILAALLFGERYWLSRDVAADFSAAAIAHSLALSGQHLGLAALLGCSCVLFLARLCPGIYLKKPRMALFALASLPFAILYLWLGNAPPSLIRAFCMLAIACVWLWRGTAFNVLDPLCMALLAILLWRPLAIFDIGLQLSVLCVAIIALLAPFLPRKLPFGQKTPKSVCARILGGFLTICAISLAIQLFLLPVTVSRFHVAGFWFPINALWLPVLGFMVLPLAALGLGFAVLPFGGHMEIAKIILDTAAFPCQMLITGLEWLKNANLLAEPALMIPHWSIFPAFAALAVALAWFLGRKHNGSHFRRARAIFIAILFMLLAAPILRTVECFHSGLGIEALDVGQGQALLLKFPPNGRLLLDGGGNPMGGFDPGKNIVAPVLADNAAPRISAVLSTHPDLDHLGGLFHLLEKFRVGAIFHNGRPAAAHVQNRWLFLQDTHQTHALKSGDVIVLGNPESGIKLEVLHPPDALQAAGGLWQGNAASLVLRLTRNGKGLALIPGDIDKAGLNHLLAQEVDISAKILFAAHHGSDNNWNSRFIKAVKPETVIASCGYQNRWHFPGNRLAKWLEAHKIPLLDTGNGGKIKISFFPDDKYKLADTRVDKKTTIANPFGNERGFIKPGFTPG